MLILYCRHDRRQRHGFRASLSFSLRFTPHTPVTLSMPFFSRPFDITPCHFSDDTYYYYFSIDDAATIFRHMIAAYVITTVIDVAATGFLL